MRGASPESAALGVAASRFFAREAALSILSFGCARRIKLRGSTVFLLSHELGYGDLDDVDRGMRRDGDPSSSDRNLAASGSAFVFLLWRWRL
jgi:hypothetical protein